MNKNYKGDLPPGQRQIWAKKYRNGASLRKLAAEYGFTPEGIRQQLKKMGVVPRPQGPEVIKESQKRLWLSCARKGMSVMQIYRLPKNKHADVTIRRYLTEQGIKPTFQYKENTIGEQAYNMRVAGLSWSEIARQLNRNTIQDVFSRARVYAMRARKPSLWPIPYKSQQNREQARAACASLHRSGMSILEISKKYDVPTTTIYRYLRQQNVKLRPPSKHGIRKDWAKRYKAGESATQIAKTSKTSPATVLRNLKLQNVTIRDRSERTINYRKKKQGRGR